MPISSGSHRLAGALAGGFGCGAFTRAPGSIAAALATLVAAGLLLLSPLVLLLAALATIATGLWAITRLGIRGDPHWIVIDEIAGQWIALLAAAAPTVPAMVAGFLFFRAFDILKPGPVGWVERAPGAWGIMADDVIAGALAALLLLVCRAIFPGFFALFPLR